MKKREKLVGKEHNLKMGRWTRFHRRMATCARRSLRRRLNAETKRETS